MLWKWIKRSFIWILIFSALLLLLQTLLFSIILLQSPAITPSDAIVVFQGRAERVRAAYTLADQNYGQALLISPANERWLKAYDRLYRPKKHIEKILETRARTTFENALYAQKAVTEKGLQRIILVTSWDHMPRSYLLLKIMLVGTQTRVFCHAVPTGTLNRKNWHHYTIGWKMVYNEMLESWGSLAELTGYMCCHQKLDHKKEKNGLLNRMKRVLIFKIDDTQLYLKKLSK